MNLTEEEFKRIVLYMKRNYGIDLAKKKVLIAGRLENYLRQQGYQSYTEYMNVVESDITGKEARQLVNHLTTNHTYFMREAEHFRFYREVVLPEIRHREKDTKDVRTWCAASSSGEEPYTLAMIMSNFFQLERGWDTTLLATDISSKVLKEAVAGVYPAEAVQTLPQDWVRRFFTKRRDGQYEVKEFLKKQVIFRQFNLMDPLPFRKKFHVVFLRNVMIYFDEPTKYKLLERIYNQMEPGGYLFIGTTEGIEHSMTRFRYVRASIYQK